MEFFQEKLVKSRDSGSHAEGCEVGMFLLVLGQLPICLCDTDAQKTTWKIMLEVENPSPFIMGDGVPLVK